MKTAIGLVLCAVVVLTTAAACPGTNPAPENVHPTETLTSVCQTTACNPPTG